MGGAGYDEGFSISVDATGNKVYLAGLFVQTVDFDPGVGTFNLTSAGGDDIFFSKFDGSGNFVWATSMGGTGGDQGYYIAPNSSGDLNVMGYFQSTVDFDPSACALNLTSFGGQDIFIGKLKETTVMPLPSISGFSPLSGPVGTPVTITGNNFSTILGNNSVRFNITPAVITASTSTSITTTVPSGATTGRIIANVNCIPAQSAIDFTVVPTLAVVPGVEWFKGIIGAPDVFIRSMTTDALGHVYIAGQFGGTVDFDPNSGVFNLTSAGNGDIFVSKLTSDGNLVWAFRLGDAGNNDAQKIAVDAVGDIYLIAGAFSSKYDTNGNLIRALPSFNASDIGTDAANDLYMTGSFTGTVDFDPGATVFNLTSAGSSDIFVLKLSSIGNFIWARRIGGTQSESPQTLALDALGNPSIAGRFGLTVDFDPGAGTANLTAVGTTDIFVLKLDNAGNYIWARRLGSGSSEGVNEITTDAAGNILITGTFSGTMDFDPGASVANNSAVGGLDAFVLKINSAGNYVWAKTVGGSGQERGNSITTDAAGDIYYTGDYDLTVDFDPGPGVFNITTSSPNQIFVSKLDASGNFLWAIGTEPGSTSFDFSSEISLLPSDKIIVTGSFEDGTIDFDPGTCTSELIPPLISVSTFLLKLSLTATCSPTITSFTPPSGPVGTTVTITGTNFSTTPANNTVLFNGTTAVVTASTTTSITTTVPVGATTGPISVTLSGNTAVSATIFTVTASPIITITTQPSDFIACLGQTATFTTAASGATNIVYQWQFSPDGIVPYTDIANGGGYSNATTATLSVNTTANFGLGRYRCRINGDFAAEVITTNQGLSINPVSTAPTVVGANRCGAGSVTLTASGGTNGQYKWYTTATGGTAIAGETNGTYVTPSITSTTNYYVSLNSNGCESTRTVVTATLTITPAPTATGASGCPASLVTLTASGGTNGQYNWYTVATGGTAIAGATNNTYPISSLAVTSTFYVSLTISGCESTRTPVTATLLSTGCAPVITTQTLTTQVEGKIEINLQSLITTPGTLDPASIKVITQPASGAVASITNFLLVIDYKGKPFSGKETIIIEACNTNGLCSQQTFTIEVAGEVIVFNAVSPNGDGKNEFLVLQYIESISPKNQVSIYNRWGDEVFAISDYDNKTRVFAGLTSSGSKIPSGTYFYRIALQNVGKTLTGFVDLRN